VGGFPIGEFRGDPGRGAERDVDADQQRRGDEQRGCRRKRVERRELDVPAEMSEAGGGEDDGGEQPVDVGENLRWSQLAACGERPVKVSGAEERARGGAQEIAERFAPDLFPRRHAPLRADALGDRLAALGTVSAGRDAAERVAAAFAEQVGFGGDDGSCASHGKWYTSWVDIVIRGDDGTADAAEDDA